jgi:uncharacterized membrane protein YhaH (DUF805 family)
MEDLTSLLADCSAVFKQTEEYRILKTYRTRDNRLTFDERLAIAKCVERSFMPFFDLMKADVPTLTDSDMLFCALSVQGFETVAIAECLTVTKDAIRMRKFRLREKLPEKWFTLLYPEQKRNSSENVTSQNPAEPAAEIPLPSDQTQKANGMKEKMSFGKAVAACFSKYFTLKGRARRAEYWNFYLFQLIIIYSYLILTTVIRGLACSHMAESAATICNNLMTTFKWIIDVALLIPMFTVTVRRLHDRDDNGWLAILLVLIPWVIISVSGILIQHYDTTYLTSGEASPSAVAGAITEFFVPFIFMVLLSKAVIIIRIILFTKPGTEGPNSFGPDPVRIIPDSTESESNI